MKRLSLILLSLLMVLCMAAQERPKQSQKFSPEKFQADLEQYITKEACLTPQEAAKFFPIYKEMLGKQRVVFDRQRQIGWAKPADESGCEKAIRQRDEFDLELKRIQQTYHNKFLSVISASKLYDVLKAEDRFHRQMLRGWNHPKGKKGEKK
ncbi:MAG: hypothetical protein IJ551_10845 [Prevotella sp.]|nr:hypothetical protein [Prevotella sp.]